MQMDFGTWLKKRRRRLDLTQEDLAARAACSVNSIRKIESGDLTPSKVLAQEIARALGLPAETHEDFVRFARTDGATREEEAFTQVPPPLRVAVDAGTEPPAPATNGARRFTTPAPLTTVIGREHDTNVIAKVLRLPSTRLVTLTGAPGTGKTRLALQVANELQDELRNGAAMASLAAITAPELVAPALAHLLEVQSNAQIPAAHAVRNFFAGQRNAAGARQL